MDQQDLLKRMDKAQQALMSIEMALWLLISISYAQYVQHSGTFARPNINVWDNKKKKEKKKGQC